MNRRAKAGSESSKVRSTKATPKRLRTDRKSHATVPAADDEAGEIVRLNRELREALEQQEATSQVLQVISSSAGELDGILQTILANATRICKAKFGVMQLREGDGLRAVAFHDVPSAYAEAMRRDPVFHPIVGHPLRRVIETKQIVHAPDARTEANIRGRIVELAGARTLLLVPMLRDKELIGIICIYRQEVRPFTDKQIELVRNFAAQAVIAIENARLLNELRESLQRQTATADVLKVISSSPGELAPVFDAMLQNAVRICDAKFGVLHRFDGDAIYAVAMLDLPPALNEFLQQRGRAKPVPGGDLENLWKSKQIVHTIDMLETPNPSPPARLAGARTQLAVPMLMDNKLVGAIIIFRQEVRPFTDKQIALVQNFAAQAVIAIENARLLNELRQSLEQQTATSDVLQVINSSTGELGPVFHAMLENATRICEAKFGLLLRYDGSAFHLAASVGTPPELSDFLKRRGPFQPVAGSHLDRLTQTRRVSHTADYAAEGIASPAVTLGGARSTIDVPMLKQDVLIGAFSIYRQEVRPFTDKQIELVESFAAQAVIAIENARLLNELRQRTTDLTEALEQQTATSDVLQVISSSPGDLGAVFDKMLKNATRICDAKFGTIDLKEGDGLRLVAAYGVPAAFAASRGEGPFHPAPGGILDMAVRTARTVHIPDLAATRSYIERHPRMVEAVEVAGIRTAVGVPMLRDDELIGIIAIFRQEVSPFTNKQIELLSNFAAQAVIAIENARLLNELRQRTTDLTEALEQQTATSEVLQVISGSPNDLQPVFATMLEKAVRICDAKFGTLYLAEDGRLRLAAAQQVPVFLEALRGVAFEPASGGMLDETMKTKGTVQVADLAATKAYIERHPRVVEAVELGGIRTTMGVPMLKDDDVIGIITIVRHEVRPFTDKQIALITTFAAQAVIAIENARLLNELRQSLEQQTATSQVLQVISGSPGELQPVFATILENAVRICEAKFGTLYLKENDGFRAAVMHNAPPLYQEARAGIIQPHPITTLWRAANTKQSVQIANVTMERGYIERDPFVVSAVELGGYRSVLSVPMVHEDTLAGVITIFRQEVRAFTKEQVSLVEDFAAQAVIAIENASLLSELRERTDQLALQSQELAKLNQQLEQRVTDQVDEIERMGRLRRFLPPQVADLIVASGSEKQLESHRREITALFCDLRGFTGFTESADAEDVMALLRDYHAAIGNIIIKYNGTLERYAGDGVMVIFNDPVPVENPALQAVLMALETREAIGKLTGRWRRFGHDLGFGIGIAHGFATLGTIGFEGRFDYAAIGTVSNVASRLCDEAKPGQILISPRVLAAVEDAVRVEPVGEFELKGIRRPLAAYNVLG